MRPHVFRCAFSSASSIHTPHFSHWASLSRTAGRSSTGTISLLAAFIAFVASHLRSTPRSLCVAGTGLTQSTQIVGAEPMSRCVAFRHPLPCPICTAHCVSRPFTPMCDSPSLAGSLKHGLRAPGRPGPPGTKWEAPVQLPCRGANLTCDFCLTARPLLIVCGISLFLPRKRRNVAAGAIPAHIAVPHGRAAVRTG